MNVRKHGRKSALWEGVLKEEPAPEIVKAVEASFAEFVRHKKTLLDHLSNEHADRSDEFDEESWWRCLTEYALAYLFWLQRPPTKKRKRDLRKLEAILRDACSLMQTVMQENVCSELGSDLISVLVDPRGPLALEEIDFKEMAAGLRTYQDVVRRRAYAVKTPSGVAPALPRSYILALANVYRQATGKRPGAGGTGGFYIFVVKFRAALDPLYETTDSNGDDRQDLSMIDAIKDALQEWRALIPRSAPGVKTPFD